MMRTKRQGGWCVCRGSQRDELGHDSKFDCRRLASVSSRGRIQHSANKKGSLVGCLSKHNAATQRRRRAVVFFFRAGGAAFLTPCCAPSVSVSITPPPVFGRQPAGGVCWLFAVCCCPPPAAPPWAFCGGSGV